MSPWLKAGLIGAVVLIGVQLLGLNPFLACFTGLLSLATYLVIGVLTAAYTPPPRDAGRIAGQGALSALLASLIGGITSLVIGLIQAATGGAAQAAQVLRQLPPEIVDVLRDSDIPLRFVFGVGGAAIGGSLFCVIGLVMAAVLGAIGGAIYAGIKPE